MLNQPKLHQSMAVLLDSQGSIILSEFVKMGLGIRLLLVFFKYKEHGILRHFGFLDPFTTPTQQQKKKKKT